MARALCYNLKDTVAVQPRQMNFTVEQERIIVWVHTSQCSSGIFYHIISFISVGMIPGIILTITPVCSNTYSSFLSYFVKPKFILLSYIS